MIRNLTPTLALALLLAGCSGDHGHDHGAGGHDHEPDAPAQAGDQPAASDPATAAESAAASSPVELQLGSRLARLEPSASALRLTVLGADGAAMVPAGDAKVVLAPTGQPEQRVTLRAEGDAWAGAAKAAGAPGYVAVVSLELDGTLQSGRVTWGDVPEPAPAATPEPDDHGHDHGADDRGHAH